MASRNDGLAEALMQFAANSAQLIEKAKASGLFKPAQTVDAKATPTPPAPEADSGSVKALQDIIVQQAMRIHNLEAEVARLTKA